MDVHDYLVLVGCLEERSAAFVLKRVGMLAAWNACRPDGYLELALDRKEERLVAKVTTPVLVSLPLKNGILSRERT